MLTLHFLQIVHKKTASVLCLTTVKNEDKLEFSKILEAIKVCLSCIFAEFYIYFVVLHASASLHCYDFKMIMNLGSIM